MSMRIWVCEYVESMFANMAESMFANMLIKPLHLSKLKLIWFLFRPMKLIKLEKMKMDKACWYMNKIYGFVVEGMN